MNRCTCGVQCAGVLTFRALSWLSVRESHRRLRSIVVDATCTPSPLTSTTIDPAFSGTPAVKYQSPRNSLPVPPTAELRSGYFVPASSVSETLTSRIASPGSSGGEPCRPSAAHLSRLAWNFRSAARGSLGRAASLTIVSSSQNSTLTRATSTPCRWKSVSTGLITRGSRPTGQVLHPPHSDERASFRLIQASGRNGSVRRKEAVRLVQSMCARLPVLAPSDGAKRFGWRHSCGANSGE